uniref:Uncharacterized protein n=1 Tax=Pristionchus pacificus TaxID=54126 RepID=A0A2A6CMS6_PRIPA|eukprot:PDM79502.1 hypothetical protein PRIPAC_32081 [Pristionchus pacificus]
MVAFSKSENAPDEGKEKVEKQSISFMIFSSPSPTFSPFHRFHVLVACVVNGTRCCAIGGERAGNEILSTLKCACSGGQRTGRRGRIKSTLTEQGFVNGFN